MLVTVDAKWDGGRYDIRPKGYRVLWDGVIAASSLLVQESIIVNRSGRYHIAFRSVFPMYSILGPIIREGMPNVQNRPR